jgi:hypothetical protein
MIIFILFYFIFESNVGVRHLFSVVNSQVEYGGVKKSMARQISIMYNPCRCYYYAVMSNTRKLKSEALHM